MVVALISIFLLINQSAAGQPKSIGSVMEGLIKTIEDTEKYDAEKLKKIQLLEDSLKQVNPENILRLHFGPSHNGVPRYFFRVKIP